MCIKWKQCEEMHKDICENICFRYASWRKRTGVIDFFDGSDVSEPDGDSI